MDWARQISLLAFAKVNLTLDIRERLPNGYHLLQSVMQQISLADELTVTLTEEEGITLNSSSAEVPTGSDNLAWKAAERFYQRLGEPPRVHITLRKEIPPQSGLGGGSSDAAATLRALNLLYGKPFSPKEMHAMAVALGSDVAFFLQGGTALVEGIGDVISPLPAPSNPVIVVAVPRVGVSTAWAYQRIDEERALIADAPLPIPCSPAMVHALREGLPWWGLLHNDFEGVVLPALPEVYQIKLRMMSLGAQASLLCGSGSGVAGFFADTNAGHKALVRLRRAGWRAWVCSFCWH